MLSKVHVIIEADGITIQDKGSHNGTKKEIRRTGGLREPVSGWWGCSQVPALGQTWDNNSENITPNFVPETPQTVKPPSSISMIQPSLFHVPESCGKYVPTIIVTIGKILIGVSDGHE